MKVENSLAKELWFDWRTKLFWTIAIKQWLSLTRWNHGFLFMLFKIARISMFNNIICSPKFNSIG